MCSNRNDGEFQIGAAADHAGSLCHRELSALPWREVPTRASASISASGSPDLEGYPGIEAISDAGRNSLFPFATVGQKKGEW